MWTYIQGLDSEILLWIQSLRMAWLDSFMVLYTTIGDAGIIWIVIGVGMLFHPKTRQAGFLALVAMLLGLVCNNIILKELVARPRPYLVLDGIQPLIPPPDPNSFPSGHTCAAFAAATIWWKLLGNRWLAVILMAMAVLMGISRLYVGVHFPTDVLVGALVGILCGIAVYLLSRRFDRPDNGQYRGKRR